MKKLAQELLDLKYEDMRTFSSFVADSIDEGPADALAIADTLLEFARLALEDAEYGEQRSAAKPDADGWIEWSGGERPVGGSTLVDLTTRDGDVFFCRKAEHWRWWQNGLAGDIIRYRLSKGGEA